jgi:hypothetical protein
MLIDDPKRQLLTILCKRPPGSGIAAAVACCESGEVGFVAERLGGARLLYGAEPGPGRPGFFFPGGLLGLLAAGALVGRRVRLPMLF